MATEAAIRVERPPWLLERLFPFKSHYIDILGAQIHYIDEGSGPTLLLLHGNPTWSFLYRDIVKGLRDRFRCIALDYPGFGLSKAPPDYDYTPAAHAEVVERFVLALGLEGLTLMVQDWGGPIGLGVAGRHAQRIRGLIIGNTFAWPVDGDPHFERFARLAGGPVGAFLIRNFNLLVNYLIPAGVKRRKLSKEIMAAYRGPFFRRQSRSATHIFPREILRSRGFLRDVEGGLSRLTQLPVLILWGDRDVAFRETERVRFERTFPRQRTVVLSGAGHFIQEDAADEIVHTIRTWYDEQVEKPTTEAAEEKPPES